MKHDTKQIMLIAECRNAECRGAIKLFVSKVTWPIKQANFSAWRDIQLELLPEESNSKIYQ
jgi:hypothetical protein